MTGRMDDASQWWSAQRRRYNLIVIVTGGICFALYMIVGSGLPNVELTAFTLAFQAVAGLLYLLAANAAYSLGAEAERRLHPTNIKRFRSTLFRVGVMLTVAPLVAVPTLLIYRRVTGT